MITATWDEREIRLRRFCYWSWLAPIVWMCAVWGLVAALGRHAWMLDLALLPLWLLIGVHLAYYAAIAHRRFPGSLRPAWILAVVAGAAAWAWAGLPAAVTAALGVPLLWCSGVAQQPPAAVASRGLRTLATIVLAVRPLALLGLVLIGWVLFATSGGEGLPPGHQTAWRLGAGACLVGVLLPSVVFLLTRRRLSVRAAQTTQPFSPDFL